MVRRQLCAGAGIRIEMTVDLSADLINDWEPCQLHLTSQSHLPSLQPSSLKRFSSFGKECHQGNERNRKSSLSHYKQNS
ncbi:hypothetical protein EMCRGX_G031552 [Ephydatia muelleri]